MNKPYSENSIRQELHSDQKISGFTLSRNCIENDYCIRECVESLLLICDEVVVSDGGSTDGTRELIERMIDKDSRIRLVDYEWKFPKGDPKWFTDWINDARSHLKFSTMVQLDADEILSNSTECHAAIREASRDGTALRVNRINYWRAKSVPEAWVIPDGHCVGKYVVRVGPSNLWMPSDEPHHANEVPLLDMAKDDHRVEIHHVGFMRRKEGFYKKSRVVIEGFFTRWDQRLEFGEAAGKELWETEAGKDYEHLLEPFKGHTPLPVQKWLADRGHVTDTYLPIIAGEAFAPKPVQVSNEAPPVGEPINVLHSGDLGDLIHGMAVFKGMGKVNLYFLDRGITKRIIERLPLITDLLKSQPYINECKPHENERIDWNASDFRHNHEITKSLARAHFDHMRTTLKKHIPFDLRSPWITGITSDPRAAGKIVVARSPRYQNHYFRWGKVVEHFGKDRLLFVGLPEEHANFTRAYGDVTFVPTKNLLEVAGLIKGSDIFIGNQSSPLAIAEAMKHPRIVEVCPWQPDVIVAHPQRDCQYSADGACDILGFTIGPAMLSPDTVATWVVPPGGWKWRDQSPNTHFQVLERIVMQTCNLDQPAAKLALIEYNAAKNPAFFETAEIKRHLLLFNQACENAKL